MQKTSTKLKPDEHEPLYAQLAKKANAGSNAHYSPCRNVC